MIELITGEYVPLSAMIQVVQEYIFLKTGQRVIIDPPQSHTELQLLGKAYDYAKNSLL
jgi:hypothetical protein